MTKILKNFRIYSLSLILGIVACSDKKQEQKNDDSPMQMNQVSITDDSLLTLVQYQTFNYFWDGAESNSGMSPERIHMDHIYPMNDENIVTSGGTGFGLMAILVGIERNFITRKEGFQRFVKIVGFLKNADRFHGAWPHWMDGKTGRVKPFSKKDNGGDLVETAFLVQGLLTVAEYFKDGNEAELELVKNIDDLWRAVEWDWYTKGGENVLYWHWSPEYGWEMNFPVEGYNECLIMYVLAASSPTHPIKSAAYHQGWARNGQITQDTVFYGLNTILNHYATNNSPVGPLFWAHYSYLGLNPKGLKDKYANYWKLNQNQALIHYKYAIENPHEFKGYGEKCWGLTSSYSMRGYAGHRPDKDIGVISPTAALSSFPYTPQKSMEMLKYLYNEADSLVGEYGPYDAFSITHNWYLPRYLAIDQGPIPVMIENYRTGLLWDLFMKNQDVKTGLNKLEFKYEK